MLSLDRSAFAPISLSIAVSSLTTSISYNTSIRFLVDVKHESEAASKHKQMQAPRPMPANKNSPSMTTQWIHHIVDPVTPLPSSTCIVFSLTSPPLVISLTFFTRCTMGTTIDSGNGSASPASLRVTDQKLGQESQVEQA